MNFFSPLLNDVLSALQNVCKEKSIDYPQDNSKVVVEPTKEVSHGDVATNVALVSSKALKMSPKELALLICEKLKVLPFVRSAEVAGPGFINLSFKRDFWLSQLLTLLEQGENYGKSTLGKNEKINVEFVSTNPTGPLHAGHGRNAVLGDTIAELLNFAGFQVTREYYVNDAGGQVNALARSVHVRYKQALGEVIDDEQFKEGMYPGDYLIPIGQVLAEKYGSQYKNEHEEKWLELFKEESVDYIMKIIKADLELAGVHMDVFTSEKALTKAGLVDETLKMLEDKGDIYVGILNPPKGFVVEEWEERPQTLFKATAYGDDVDRALKKSDGSWTYFAGDVAYHYDKFKRGFTHMIDVFGADHAGYLKRLTAAVSAITHQKAHFDIKVCQMVNFMENGKPMRMSKRAGTFITFKDVIDRVGKDAARYMMVSRHQDMGLDFDFVKVLEQSKDNPIFYIQYAHARIHSVLRHMKTMDDQFDLKSLKNIDLSPLSDESELLLIKTLCNWPRIIESAASVKEPHRIANALYEIASVFHSLWNKGKENTQLRFIDSEKMDVTLARLALIYATATVIKTGLKILGITALEELRS